MEQLPSSSTSKYAACDHIKRKTLEHFTIDEETLRSFTTECNVLPLLEKKIFDHSHMKHYSLQTNGSLRCRWQEFLSQQDGQQRMPFQFPGANDFHFYNYHTRYEPSQSIRNRNQLKQIIGRVVTRGYSPVPYEMHTRKTIVNVRKPRERPAKKKWAKRLLKY